MNEQENAPLKKSGHSTSKLAALMSIAAVGGLLIGGGGGIAIGAANSSSASETVAEPKQTPEVEPVAEEPAPEPSPLARERGNLVKMVGESGGIGNSEPLEVEFTVTGITVDPECTGEYPQPSLNGHFVKLDLEVVTSAEAQGDFGFSFWKWIRPDGTTANTDPRQDGNGYMCLSAAESLPDRIGPAETVSGSIVLDVQDAEGILVAQPSYAGTTGSWTWEWAVPAG